MRRPIVVLLSFLLVAACGGGDGTVATTSPGTPTTAATTTTLVFTIDPANLLPVVFGGPDAAHGSGCVPGAAILPDGVWFGFVTGRFGGGLSLDLACFYTGAAAANAAAAMGEEGFDGDFYIINSSPGTYPVTLETDRPVWGLAGGGSDLVEMVANGWPAPGTTRCPSAECAVWVYVNNAIATGLVEQYLP